MVIDPGTFTDITRHLHDISAGLLDGMRNVVRLNPDAPTTDSNRQREDWGKAVEAFVRVNAEVLTLTKLLRALLAANNELEEHKPALS